MPKVFAAFAPRCRAFWRRLSRALVLVGLALIWAPASWGQAAPTDDEARIALTSDIRFWLSRHEGIDPLQIEVVPLDARLRVPDCPGGWAISLPFNNTQSVRARCEAIEPAREYIVRTRIEALAQEVALARDLPAGHALQRSDLRLSTVLPGQSAVFTDIEPLVGRRLVQDLRAGMRLRPDDLAAHVQVTRLTRATRAGQRLSPADVSTQTVAAELAPADFWAADWPEPAIIARALPAGHILRQGDWASMVTAVVTTADVPRGAMLTPDMLSLQSLPQTQQSAQWLDSLAQATYSETVRPLRRGTPVSRLDVRAATLVKRGAKVQISVGKGKGFEISTQVEALEDGRLGEQIRLINRQSGRIIQGMVTGANTAEAL